LSAILKALRKIEKESSGKVQSQSFSKGLDAKKVINQRARKAWVLRRVLSVLVPFMVLVTVIVLIIAVKAFRPEGAVLLSKVPRVHGEDEKGRKVSAPERRGEYEQSPEGVLRLQTSRAESGTLRSATGSSSVQDRPSASEKNPDTSTALKSTRRPLPSAITQPQPKPVPGLQLQAIAWSDDPASCFAVINGRIVRSGGMVSGVSVVEISKDAVSLKLGDKAWTVRMLEGD
jgi:hypothetical protein